MRRLRLREYETTTSVSLSRDECDALASAIPSLRITPTPQRPGCYDLQPESYIGALRVGENLVIEIRPKLPIERVLFLISYALNPKSWQVQHLGFGTSPDLVEAVIPGFVKQLRRALRWGLLRGYREREDALTTLRGRIRMQQQVSRRFGRALPVEVRFDEYTEDIEENRLLRAAIEELGRFRIRSAEARRSLRAFEVTFSTVERIRYDTRCLPEIYYTRLNEHYRPAVELAKLILRSTSTELRPGFVHSSGFLVDMNQVFEDFVVVALRESLSVSERTFVQGARGKRLYLDEHEYIGLRPDISWWEGSRCVFVGDVKYKSIAPAGMPHADLYQLLGYTIATNLTSGLLIYASGEGEARSYRVSQVGKELQVVTLNLAGGPDEVLEQVRAVAALVWSMRRPVASIEAA